MVEHIQGKPIEFGRVHADHVVVPKIIEEVAKGIAESFWENDFEKEARGVRSSAFRANYPNKDWYIRSCWPHWIKDARYVLAEMLKDSTKPEAMKDEIYDALTYGFDQRTQHYPPPSKLYQFAEGEPEPKVILKRV
jgi:hypothetical protein